LQIIDSPKSGLRHPSPGVVTSCSHYTIKRRAAGETLASIAKSYGVHLAMISRL
jgi:hypothetical protein